MILSLNASTNAGYYREAWVSVKQVNIWWNQEPPVSFNYDLVKASGFICLECGFISYQFMLCYTTILVSSKLLWLILCYFMCCVLLVMELLLLLWRRLNYSTRVLPIVMKWWMKYSCNLAFFFACFTMKLKFWCATFLENKKQSNWKKLLNET